MSHYLTLRDTMDCAREMMGRTEDRVSAETDNCDGMRPVQDVLANESCMADYFKEEHLERVRGLYGAYVRPGVQGQEAAEHRFAGFA